MRPRSLPFAIAQTDAQAAPIIVVSVTTPHGIRVYSSSGLTDSEWWDDLGMPADGTTQADGSEAAGSQLVPTISREPRVVSYGAMRDTGSILPTIAMRGRRAREVGNVEVTLRNDDDHFGTVLSQDTLISATITIAVGFRGLVRRDYITRFQGVVQELLLTREQLTLRAETA